MSRMNERGFPWCGCKVKRHAKSLVPVMDLLGDGRELAVAKPSLKLGIFPYFHNTEFLI